MMTFPLVLRLNKTGTPIDWVRAETAACLIVKKLVSWHMGEHTFRLHGGYNRFGKQSILEVPAIIATDGHVHFQNFAPTLTNSVLFRRDHNSCLYCGNAFARQDLTRDHVIPRCQGGKETWLNIVTACRRCNHRKGAKTPDEAGMPLLALPYVPNRFEFMVMANRRILADQMDFLKTGFSNNFKPQ